jgi:hypothetical protein
MKFANSASHADVLISGPSGEKAYDLQFNGLSLQLDRPNLEIHSDGRDVRFSVGIVGESKQET